MRYQRILAILCLASLLTSTALAAPVTVPAPTTTTTTTTATPSWTVPTWGTPSWSTTTTTTTTTTGTDWNSVTATAGAVLPFADVATIVYRDNLTVLANAAGLEALRRETAESIDELEDTIEELEDAISEMKTQIKALGAVNTAEATAAIAQLEAQISTIEAQITQLEDAIDQLEDIDFDEIESGYDMMADAQAMAAESMYIGLASLEQSMDGLRRSQVVVVNTVTEMEERFKLGQIAEIDLLQVKQSQTELDSGLLSMTASANDLKGDINVLLGRDANFAFSVGTLPQVTATMMTGLSLSSDTNQAISNSKTVDAAEDKLTDAKDKDNAGEKYYILQAELELQAAENNVTQGMNKLYSALQDKYRLIGVQQGAATLASKQLAVNQLKYEQGTLSRSELLTAEQENEEAKSAVVSAQIEAYGAYMQYQWAIKGIMQ